MKEEDNGVFFFSSRKQKKHIPYKNAKKRGSLPFFSHFYFWDEVLFFHSLNVLGTLSFPHSCNVELCTFLKPCAMKLCGAETREFY
jgi:hypothetical protein